MMIERTLYAIFRLLVMGSLLALSSVTANAEVAGTSKLIPMEATYRASLDKGIAFNGSATRTLEQKEDGSWLYSFTVESFIADIHETSRLNWDGIQSRPSTYRYALEGMMIPDRHRSIDFSWGNHKAFGEYEGKDVDLTYPPDALDPLAYQLQLRQDVKRGMQEMHYQVVEKNRVEESTFAVVDTETLTGKFGNIDAVKVEKVRAPEKKRKTLLWFAPEWDYLLVRLVQIEDDDTRYEIHLEGAKINGEPIQVPPKSQAPRRQ